MQNLELTAGAQGQGLVKDWMTTKEVMEYLGVVRLTLEKWVKRGVIKQNKVGGKIFYNMEYIHQLVIKG
jgi:excisionase family DNA binding protein